MKVVFMSDLHVEFGRLEKPLPEGDVLLLAGDTTVLEYLEPHRTDPAARAAQRATKHLSDQIAKKFKRAFATWGNHESYGSDYADTGEALARALPAVTVLGCDHVALSDDVILFGAPLWTSMDKGSPLSSLAIRNGMNDFRVIKTAGGLFTPEMAAEEFHRTVAYLGKLAEENRDKTIVCMTHHAPSVLGTPSGIRHMGDALAAAYYSDLDQFILDHPNIRVWVHGHTHIRREYQIGQCRLYTNARGYFQNDSLWRSFDPDKSFEI